MKGSSNKADDERRDKGGRVRPDELMAMLDSDRDVSLIDVRSPYEFKSGHIPGSVSVPLGLLPLFDASLCKGTIIVYCASGIRSARARKILALMGVDALDLKGGVKAWVASGGSLATGVQ